MTEEATLGEVMLQPNKVTLEEVTLEEVTPAAVTPGEATRVEATLETDSPGKVTLKMDSPGAVMLEALRANSAQTSTGSTPC